MVFALESFDFQVDLMILSVFKSLYFILFRTICIFPLIYRVGEDKKARKLTSQRNSFEQKTVNIDKVT